MWQEAPIYDRLVTELGDIPAQVRSEAERTARDLERVMRPNTALTGRHPQQAWPFPPGQ